MQVNQKILTAKTYAVSDFSELAQGQPDLVLVFGSPQQMQLAAPALQLALKDAVLAGCTTAGEISQKGVSDESLVLTSVRFDTSRVKRVATVLRGMADSLDAGRRLASQLQSQVLVGVLVLTQGVEINGSALVQGMTDVLGSSIPITGGMAGDGTAFTRTWVIDNEGLSAERVLAIGFYGADLQVSHGSYGGWSPFGPARKVTHAEGNVLYALDNEPALAVYKRYLGDYASGLPVSGLLFPFAMLGKHHNETGLIRTVLSVDEQIGSVTLAGDIDPDGYVRLMHANTDALVEGASVAAVAARGVEASVVDGTGSTGSGQRLALLVSCVGRKLVMGDRVEEEVEAVAEVFGKNALIGGFYSFGELCPMSGASECKLHNQTMTISYFSERSPAAGV